MTMIDTRIVGETPADAAWHEVEDGFWVGNTEGRFLGTIERHDPDRFFARDEMRSYVGEFRSLAEARRAIAERTG
ncbi:MAG: hypothetical protein J0J00_10345 [Microbacterium sp.]|nr:hypothetical protein [Microbacterium sp.]